MSQKNNKQKNFQIILLSKKDSMQVFRIAKKAYPTSFQFILMFTELDITVFGLLDLLKIDLYTLCSSRVERWRCFLTAPRIFVMASTSQ